MISGRIPHEVVVRARSVDPRVGFVPPRARESAARRVRVGTEAGGVPLLDQGGPLKASTWLAPAGAAPGVVLATAGTAAGASRHHGGGTYTVTPLVSDQ